jgi:hypothetical protein
MMIMGSSRGKIFVASGDILEGENVANVALDLDGCDIRELLAPKRFGDRNPL